MKELTFKHINKADLTEEVWGKFNPYLSLEDWPEDIDGWEEKFFGAYNEGKLVAFVAYTNAVGGRDLVMGELPEGYDNWNKWHYITAVASILPGAGKAIINELQSKLLTPVILESANNDLIGYYEGLGFKELIPHSYYMSRDRI